MSLAEQMALDAAQPAPQDQAQIPLSARMAQDVSVPSGGTSTAESPWYDTGTARAIRGVFEPAAHAATWIGSAIPAGLAGFGRLAYGTVTGEPDPLTPASALTSRIQQAGTFQPVTETGKGIENIATGEYNPLTWIPRGAHWTGQKVGDITGSPAAGFSTENAINILAPFGLAKAFQAAPTATTEPESTPITGRQSQFGSAGSAGATSVAGSANASPEIQAAIAKAAQENNINPDAAARVVEADSLPVPMRLTKGQASQDVNLLSWEQNNRGAVPALAEAYNAQNKGLVSNLDALRDQVGPDVFSKNTVEHGDTLISAYQDLDNAEKTNIAAKYQALRDANGGAFPIDAPTLVENINKKLSDNLLSKQDPGGQLSELTDLARRGGMTYENFEAMRTNLARIQRSSADGNAVAAAGIMRDAMEDLPLQPGTAAVKGLADEARAAARTRFQTIENDPAYSAVVNGTATPDTFIDRFITGTRASRDNVATMRQNLSGNDNALQTINTGVVDRLRSSAGIDPQGNGNFTQAGYNKQLLALQPKIDVLVPPDIAQHFQTLGNVARNTQFQPRGAYVNNSNTLTGALAEGARALGGHAVEAGANIATKGAYSIISPLVKSVAGKYKQQAAIKAAEEQSLNPASVVSNTAPKLGNVK